MTTGGPSPRAGVRLDHDPIKPDHDLISSSEHDLFGKPMPTFPDHALGGPNGREEALDLLLQALGLLCELAGRTENQLGGGADLA